ncbi:hypothetical protein GCM10020218_021960 [Dactylosporangium vinaceum]
MPTVPRIKLPHERSPAEWDAVRARARVRAARRSHIGRKPVGLAERPAAGFPGGPPVAPAQ